MYRTDASNNLEKIFGTDPSFVYGDNKEVEALFNKTYKDSRLRKTLYLAYKKASKKGIVYISALKTEDGADFVIAEDGAHTMVNNKLFEAYTYEKMLKGDTQLYIVRRFTKEVMETEIYQIAEQSQFAYGS